MEDKKTDKLIQFFKTLGIFNDTSISLKLESSTGEIEIDYEGTKLDIITLLQYGTLQILKDTNYPIERYIEFLKMVSSFDNKTSEQKRMDDVMLQMIINAFDKK